MKILIVDDDADLLALVGFALRAGRFTTVVKATDAHRGVAIFAAETPDLAILDINLPGGSGFDVCEAIRKQSRIPIMMLTARGEEEDLVQGARSRRRRLPDQAVQSAHAAGARARAAAPRRPRSGRRDDARAR